MISVTTPLNTALTSAFRDVVIVIPALFNFTCLKTGCTFTPNFSETNPCSTGQGNFPLFLAKSSEISFSSGVNRYVEFLLPDFLV